MPRTDTLGTAPLAPLLDRLLADDEASPDPALDALPPAERDRLLRDPAATRELYARLSHLPLAVSRETGTLLYAQARAVRARAVVEFGTSFGVSTLFLAAALRDNGGGRLLTTEFEASKLARARANLAEAGLDDLVEFREGDALLTLSADLPASIDLVLLDGAKPLYAPILDLLELRLRPGAVLVADDADRAPDYLARVRSPDAGYLSLPFGSDVELSVRLH